MSSKSPYRLLRPTEIRLVEILPGDFEESIQLVLKTVDLQDKPVYDALSYVWNPTDGTVDASKDIEPAVIQGSPDVPVQLTANLDVAIRYLRQHKPATPALWIDALCINQKDELERNHQVGLMSTIYTSADDVRIWLGPPCAATEIAFKILLDGKLGESKMGYDQLRAIENLLDRSWFGRLWIAQELTLCRRDPVIHHGSQTLDWKTFVRSVGIVHENIQRKNSGAENRTRMGNSYRKLEDQATNVLLLRNMRNDGPKARFGQRMIHTSYLRATDSRDRVYGLLGFSVFDKEQIEPDYNKTFKDIYARAATIVIREGFSDYLELLNKLYLYPSTTCIISWFPDVRFSTLAPRFGSSISPSSCILEAALSRTHIERPVVEFSKDSQTVSTLGRALGRVENLARIGNFRESRHDTEPRWTGILRFAELRPSSEYAVSALLGSFILVEPDRRSVVALLDDFRGSKLEKLDDWTRFRNRLNEPGCKAFKNLVESYGRLTMFITDTGFFGIATYCQPRDWKRLIVVGLFGIDLPFILDPQPDGTYKMVSPAHLVGHTLGNEDLAKVAPFMDWREAGKQCGLQEVTIV